MGVTMQLYIDKCILYYMVMVRALRVLDHFLLPHHVGSHMLSSEDLSLFLEDG